MEFTSLSIRRRTWQAGSPMSGELEIAGAAGKIELVLTEQNCQDILAVIASRLIEQAKESAIALTSSIVEATQPRALSDQTKTD